MSFIIWEISLCLNRGPLIVVFIIFFWCLVKMLRFLKMLASWCKPYILVFFVFCYTARVALVCATWGQDIAVKFASLHVFPVMLSRQLFGTRHVNALVRGTPKLWSSARQSFDKRHTNALVCGVPTLWYAACKLMVQLKSSTTFDKKPYFSRDCLWINFVFTIISRTWSLKLKKLQLRKALFINK